MPSANHPADKPAALRGLNDRLNRALRAVRIKIVLGALLFALGTLGAALSVLSSL